MGHVDRLLHLLDHPDTTVSRQRLILTLLGEIQAARGYPVLIEKLQDGRVAKEAAKALGFFGLRAQSHLLHIVQDRSNPQLQAAAAKGLGRIAAATGNSGQTCAEWGHVDRLLHLLDHSDTTVSRQRLILTLLGEIQAARGYPVLIEKLQDGRVAKEAAKALGFFGLRAQSHLLHIVQDRSNPQLQAAAAKGLGRIAAATGNSGQTPLYLKMVTDSTIDIRVRIELSWALGKAPDMRAFSTLTQLEQHIWTNPPQDPHLQEFREAVDWSIREVKQGGHGDDF